MFLLRLIVGVCTLAALSEDFGILPSTVVLADGDTIIYDVHQEKKTWEDASDSCKANGSALAFILTKEQYKALREHIKQHNLLPADIESGYWLGAKYRNGKWKWEMTGTDTRDDNYFMAGWYWEEPDRRERNGEKQDCMELRYIKTDKFVESLAWNDMWCDEKRGFVCQSFGHKDTT